MLKTNQALILFTLMPHISALNQLHMKKYLLLTLSFMVIYAGAQAQISKGTVLLGGDLSFGTNKTETGTVKSKTTGFSISPSVGIAFKDNKVLGLSLYYGHTV